MKHAKSSRIVSLLALVLAVTMLLALVGCGESDKKDDPSKTTTTTTTTTVAGSEDTTTTGGDESTTTSGDESTTSATEDTTATTGDSFFGTTTTGGNSGSKTTAGRPAAELLPELLELLPDEDSSEQPVKNIAALIAQAITRASFLNIFIFPFLIGLRLLLI